MKKKDIQELKNKPAAELQQIVVDTTERLRALRFDLAAGKVKNFSQIHEAKKQIARANTFLKTQQ